MFPRRFVRPVFVAVTVVGVGAANIVDEFGRRFGRGGKGAKNRVVKLSSEVRRKG